MADFYWLKKWLIFIGLNNNKKKKRTVKKQKRKHNDLDLLIYEVFGVL